MVDQKRYLALILGLCLLLCAALIVVSQQVQEREAELAELSQEIKAVKEEYRALKAEWSYLTRPEHLSSLTEGDSRPEQGLQ